MKKSKLITMIISLLAAFLLWVYVVTIVNPEGEITLSDIPVSFSGEEVLREDQGFVITEGKDIEIAFNVRYVSDVLKVLTDENVCMRFNSNVSPCVICPQEGDAYLYLVLPVRVFAS